MYYTAEIYIFKKYICLNNLLPLKRKTLSALFIIYKLNNTTFFLKPNNRDPVYLYMAPEIYKTI